MRAIGLLGSVEALASALAPIAGIWLLAIGGWQLSFEVIGALALVLAGAIWAFAAIPQTARRHEGSYSRLLRDLVYLRYALSQALVLGGLLIFVFGLPAAFVHALGATLRDFVIVQICGTGAFVVAANLSGRLAERFGAERVILFGTSLAAAGSVWLLIYALAGGKSSAVVAMLCVPFSPLPTAFSQSSQLSTSGTVHARCGPKNVCAQARASSRAVCSALFGCSCGDNQQISPASAAPVSIPGP